MPGCRSRRDLVVLCLLVRGGDDDRRFRGIGRAWAGICGVGAVRRDRRQCWRVLQQRCLNVHDGLSAKTDRQPLLIIASGRSLFLND